MTPEICLTCGHRGFDHAFGGISCMSAGNGADGYCDCTTYRTGTLYRHATMTNVYVYEDADDMLWQMPMTPGGWNQKRPYIGYRESLREIAPETQRVLAATVGVQP